jgi:hypothetical protein
MDRAGLIIKSRDMIHLLNGNAFRALRRAVV